MKEPHLMHRPTSVGVAGLLVAAAIWLGGMILGLEPHAREVLLRTMGLGLGASLVALPLGVVTASMCHVAGYLSRMLLMAVCSLALLPLLIHVSGWDAAFGKLGWLSSIRGQVLTPIVSGWFAAIWIHGLAAVPQLALLLLAVEGRRDEESQASLDASRWQVWSRITWPRIRPLLMMMAIWILITCSREIAVTDLYQIGTLAEEIYLGYALDDGQGEAVAGAGNSWALLGLVAFMTLLGTVGFLFFTRREFESTIAEPVRRPATPGTRLTTAGLLLLLVGVPIGNVLVRASFQVTRVNGQPTAGYSLSRIGDAVQRSVVDYADEIGWSLIIAITSASLILLVAIAAAWLARRSVRWRIGFAFALALSCAIPGPAIGLWLARRFSVVSWDAVHWLTDYTIFGPTVATTFFCWPIGGILTWFLMRRIPESVLESARLEGATPWRRLWSFGIRANRFGLAGIWLLLMTVCFGELSASQMVRPAGMDTVPRKMLGDLHAGVNELTAGITLVLAAGVTVISLLGWGMLWLNRIALDRQWSLGRKLRTDE